MWTSQTAGKPSAKDLQNDSLATLLDQWHKIRLVQRRSGSLRPCFVPVHALPLVLSVKTPVENSSDFAALRPHRVVADERLRFVVGRFGGVVGEYFLPEAAVGYDGRVAVEDFCRDRGHDDGPGFDDPEPGKRRSKNLTSSENFNDKVLLLFDRLSLPERSSLYNCSSISQVFSLSNLTIEIGKFGMKAVMFWS